MVKLSVVIINWNDVECILECIESVYTQTTSIPFEIIVADNGSSDGSVSLIRERFPKVRIIENRANLGFGKGNNAGISVAQGNYVLILNPDTIIHDRALEKLVAYADRFPEAGAFGCRTLNRDGSLQHTAQPIPTDWRCLMAALCLRWLGRISDRFAADSYVGWDGCTEREIGFQAGCSLLVRGSLLKTLGGFDERFSHQFEDADLCHRVWKSGNSVRYCPDAEITHIGGQNRGRYPISVVLETERSKYRYFHKHYGIKGVMRIRYVSLLAMVSRYAGYRLLRFFVQQEALDNRLKMYRLLLNWHWFLNPVRFVDMGQEPKISQETLTSAANPMARIITKADQP